MVVAYLVPIVSCHCLLLLSHGCCLFCVVMVEPLSIYSMYTQDNLLGICVGYFSAVAVAVAKGLKLKRWH